MITEINISDYDYALPDEKIAKFPLPERDSSKLLVYQDGAVSDRMFSEIGGILPEGALLVFNNTKVVRARVVFFKETGARIEIFCLEPNEPADYERAFAQKGKCRWHCIIGNLKKWKEGPLRTVFEYDGDSCELCARHVEDHGGEHIVEFSWDADATFGQLLEMLGRMPIPPYLNRDSQDIDNTRYQTVYSRFEGSVAAPTAGLHFSERVIAGLCEYGITTAEVTLHVGAGTFLPVKSENAAEHPMHTEHFEVAPDTIRELIDRSGKIVSVGTTSVRTLESLAVLGYRVMKTGDAAESRVVGQWEAYDIPDEFSGKELLSALAGYMEREGIGKLKSATRIMITPAGFRFRVVNVLVTNFHQPKSTLLLLISAVVGDRWHDIYTHALANDYRFLSYGDSSVLFI